MKCTACGEKTPEFIQHPLLDVPICKDCLDTYCNGEFTDEDGNEIYCRWCGEGEGGELFLCDSCPKTFCSGCVKRNFGSIECHKIHDLKERWTCFVCSPTPVYDLCVANGWATENRGTAIKIKKTKRNGGMKNCIYEDVSRGREKLPIPVFNEVDDASPPLDFVYVTRPVSEGVPMTNNPSFLLCCTCTDNCRDPNRCECAQLMDGFAYDTTKTLSADKPAGIYECNSRCSCHIDRCTNRVVGLGPRLPLEVFRCADPNKGWGVRCAEDIPAGKYVADYIGEIMVESDAEKRGLEKGDEYLYTLDQWGRSQACSRLRDLRMKTGLRDLPRELDIDITNMSSEELLELLGPEITAAHPIGEESAASVSELALKAVNRAPQSRFLYSESNGDEDENEENDEPVAGKRGRKHGKGPEKEAGKIGGGKTAAAAVVGGGGGGGGGGHIVLCGEVSRIGSEKKKHKKKLNSSSSSPSSRQLDSRNEQPITNELSAGQASVRQMTLEDDLDVVVEDKILLPPPIFGSAGSTWADESIEHRLGDWREARSLITDRAMLETEMQFNTYVTDARWHGSVGRFLNHSCDPNLFILTVFVDSHDIRRPRIAFFTKKLVAAGTELCYDYGYFEGNVAGKHRKCLCGSVNCRKVLY